MADIPESTKLLPCPFCGGDAQRHTIGQEEPDNAGGDVIACIRCQASSHIEFGRKENLISRWNTRAAPPAIDREAVDMDWRLVAKLAGDHGVRYRTNRAFEQFVTAILSTLSADAIRQGEGCDQCKGFGYLVMAAATCSEGGDKMPCPKCQTPSNTILATPASDGGKA